MFMALAVNPYNPSNVTGRKIGAQTLDFLQNKWPGRVAQSVVRLTNKPEVPASIPGLFTCFSFSVHWFKKDSCPLLEKECAQSTD